MSFLTLEETKKYLRVDSNYEDDMILVFLNSAIRMCLDVARLSDEEWAEIDSDKEGAEEKRSLLKIGVLYAVGYMYEHREEADYRGLSSDLRSLLEPIRKGAF